MKEQHSKSCKGNAKPVTLFTQNTHGLHTFLVLQIAGERAPSALKSIGWLDL